jgi:hypothetical protein
LEAEHLPFDKALLACDDFCGHCTPDKVRPYSWRQTTHAAIPHPTKFSSGGFWLGFHTGHGAPHAATTRPRGRAPWLGRGRTVTSEWATTVLPTAAFDASGTSPARVP